jgi:hypothetical protein
MDDRLVDCLFGPSVRVQHEAPDEHPLGRCAG